MNFKRLRQTVITLGATLAVNILLILALRTLNRPRRVAPQQAPPSMVRFRTIPQAQMAEPPTEPPAPPEPQTLPTPDEMALNLPAPEIQPLNLPAVSLDTNVRLPRLQERRPPATPQVAAAETAESQPAALAPTAMGEGEVDTPPRPLRDPQPAYPQSAVRRGLQGHVTVELLVDRHGEVVQLHIADRQGPPSFERSVRETILSEWRFEPGRHQNQAVPTWVRRRIEFRIQR